MEIRAGGALGVLHHAERRAVPHPAQHPSVLVGGEVFVGRQLDRACRRAREIDVGQCPPTPRADATDRHDGSGVSAGGHGRRRHGVALGDRLSGTEPAPPERALPAGPRVDRHELSLAIDAGALELLDEKDAPVAAREGSLRRRRIDNHCGHDQRSEGPASHGPKTRPEQAELRHRCISRGSWLSAAGPGGRWSQVAGQ